MLKKTRKKSKKINISKVPFILIGIIAIILFAAFYTRFTSTFYNSPQKAKAPAFDYVNQNVGTGVLPTMGSQAISPSGTRGAGILIDSPGGSGTFYYLVGATVKNGMNVYSEPVPLGDRIIIKSLTVKDAATHNHGEITVTYLDRPEGAPMSDEPTKEVVEKYAFENNGNLIEVAR